MTTKETNKQFAKTNTDFIFACQNAPQITRIKKGDRGSFIKVKNNLQPSKRQAGKFRRKTGLAYTTMMKNKNKGE